MEQQNAGKTGGVKSVPRSWALDELLDRITYRSKHHLHHQPLRGVDNTDDEKDSLREEVKALRRRVADQDLLIDALRQELLEDGR